MLVDSHCHLDRVDLDPYDGDFARLMQTTRAAGVARLLCVAIDLERYPAMRALIEPFPEVSVSVGVHPNERDGHEPSADELVALAGDPRVVAIGETGLDYYRSTGDPGWQQQRFRRHIAAARTARRPLIVHSRAARADTIRILAEERAGEVGGVLHCFTEDWETARRALDLGFHISFSGIVTFKAADELREVARRVPLDRLLIETDSPYLAPVPHRGRSNEPRYVAAVADCLAGLRGLAPDALAAATGENFFRLFERVPRVLPGEAAPS
ncbi:TatD family hydrolase [Thiococcus pfennigii]|uniref:TatD family hydrolase n=1 Tax=Thiococcus pfennigii TaxID=1057 RepID=UPI0019055D9E|nr:TatD family hydrolase [Thiococcus pfennigii]MBK1731291.1 TatD family deoxyribonuclease [Thiococcus pfennigii]